MRFYLFSALIWAFSSAQALDHKPNLPPGYEVDTGTPLYALVRDYLDAAMPVPDSAGIDCLAYGLQFGVKGGALRYFPRIDRNGSTVQSELLLLLNQEGMPTHRVIRFQGQWVLAPYLHNREDAVAKAPVIELRRTQGTVEIVRGAPVEVPVRIEVEESAAFGSLVGAVSAGGLNGLVLASGLTRMPPPGIPVDEPYARQLVKQLGAPNFRQRVWASGALAHSILHLHAPARAAVEAAVKDPDLERSHRAEQVLKDSSR